MSLNKSSANQAGLSGFGEGNVVKLDGGKRIRLDDRVDFWPGTQAWETVVDGPTSPTKGVGVNSMLDYLKRMREADGRLVAMPEPIHTNVKVFCNYCGKPAELHGGLEVYPDRQDLADRKFWVCWKCNAWVGCHRDSVKPFGELANDELRSARIAAHNAFDPVWQQMLLPRSEAYEWLARSLGIPRLRCHIGMMALEDCRRVGQAVWERFGHINT